MDLLLSTAGVVPLLTAGLMNLHYECVRKAYDGCPLPLLDGDSQAGKLSSVKCALAIMGMDIEDVFMTTSQVWRCERLCNGSLYVY